MMFNKLDTSKSPFILRAIPQQEENNILEDWRRLDSSPIYINGIHVQEILRKERNLPHLPSAGPDLFRSLDELKKFFIKHLLVNVSKDVIDSAIEVLFETLHQGSWQRPVSSTAYTCLSAASNYKIGPQDAQRNKPGDPAQKRRTDFIVSPNGFLIQENVTQYKCSYSIDAGNLAGEDILPDRGKSFIYKAQATLAIDFSVDRRLEQEVRWPKVDLINNSISYGNKQIQKLIDTRSFFQKISDFIKNIFGNKKVKHLVPAESGEVNESFLKHKQN